MATWNGWAEDFLVVGHLPQTPSNVAFLHDWAKNAEAPGCARNPIDLTALNSGSHDCKTSLNAVRPYQAYSAHVWARTAFAAQIGRRRYRHLRAALKSGNPYTFANWTGVVDDLGKWESYTFAAIIFAQRQSEQGSGSIGARAHHGWNDLRRTANTVAPAAISNARHTTAAALRTLHRARKVRL